MSETEKKKRLIDADMLEDDFDLCNFLDSSWTPQRVHQMIARQTTIDAVPVVHGKWIESHNLDDCFWICSECKFCSIAALAPSLEVTLRAYCSPSVPVPFVTALTVEN